MEETFLDSVSRWLGYIALSWVTYLIYVASGVSIADCVSAILSPKKAEAPQIQVIPATPSTPDKTFEKFELPPQQAEKQKKKKKPAQPTVPENEVSNDVSNNVGFVLNAPNRKTKTTENADHPSDGVTSECTAPETSVMVAAAASATTSAMQPNASTKLCDPMCDPVTRFNVTRCSFSVEKAQTLPSIKILTPEDVCPPGTLISSGLPESGKNDDNSDSDSTSPASTTTNTSDPSPALAPARAPFDCENHSLTNLTDRHSPQKSNESGHGTTATAERRTGGDDLLVRMLCDIDQVDFHHDLKQPRPSVDEPLTASHAALLLDKANNNGKPRQPLQQAVQRAQQQVQKANPQVQQTQQRTQQEQQQVQQAQQQIQQGQQNLQKAQQQLQHKHRKPHKQQQQKSVSEKAVRFTLPGDERTVGDAALDCFDDSCSDEQDCEFHESPDSDDEDSEGSPSTQRKTPSRVTNTSSPTQQQQHQHKHSAATSASPLYDSLLKDLSDEALDEAAAHVDTECVLDALLFQTRRRRSLPTVQSPGGDYEMVYREKLERQSLGDSAILTETSASPSKFKASLRDEDFTDLLPPLSPDCGYDSLSEVVSSPDEFDCYGSAPQLSVIIEDPFEEDRNNVSKKTTLIQNGNTMTAPAAAADAVGSESSSLTNRFTAPTEDFDSDFATVRL